MSKHVRKKCGKLYVPSFLVSKGAYHQQKLTEIDDTQTWSNVRNKKVTYKMSTQHVKACRRKVRKTVTDGRTETRRPGRRPGQTSPYHNTSRLKTGVLKKKGKLRKFYIFSFKWGMTPQYNLHVGKKCEKQSDARTNGRTPGRTSPYHNTSCLKTGV